MMNLYEIGLSALSTSQRAMDLAGQNIANATTPGYHRQSLTLTPRILAGRVAAGVDILQTRRLYESSIERAMTNQTSRTGRVQAELNTARRLETLYTPGTGSVSDRTEQLFNQLGELTAHPDDMAQRRIVLESASGLAGELNNMARGMSQLQVDLRAQIDDSVSQINQKATDLADYNKKIEAIEKSGGSANELRDQRDVILNDLAGLIDVRVTEQPYGVVNVIAGNAALVVGGVSGALATSTDAAGAVSITPAGSAARLSLKEGALTGQVNTHNAILSQHLPALDAFAQQLASGLDTLQATGVGLNGPSTSLVGSRGVNSATAPLATAGTAFPVQAGSLFVSVTNQATNQRTLTEVAFDPATQSLQDLAGAITAATGGQVQASVTSDLRLQMQAQAGYSFDFAGRQPTEPTNVAMNGTAVPIISGNYTGTANGAFSFNVVGAGSVGAGNVRLEVRDTDGALVRTVNIGQGYIPGTPIDVGNGLTVRLGSGTTSAGSFSVPVAGTPDTTGALAALGTNSIFKGSNALTLAVRPEMKNDPTLLAGSRDGQRGDGSNFGRMEALRDRKALAGGTETFLENLASQTSGAGTAVRSKEDEQESLDSLGLSLQAQQQNVSGVDPNEEALNLLQSQRQFQMATRYISAVNTALDDLLNIVR